MFILLDKSYFLISQLFLTQIAYFTFCIKN